MNNDYINWVFSAAAQSISAFIAFLLTGYALVHALMEAAREKDDTLDDIHFALRKKYYGWLTALSSATGAAVILSLVTVFANRWEFKGKAWLVGLTSVVDFAVIIGGVGFVISIVNPTRYRRTAEKVLEEQKTELRLTGKTASSSTFFEQFRHLERLIRDHLRKKQLYIPSKGSPRMSFSFRQMIEALLQNEEIDSQFFDDLMQLNKYRNLVFHGHVDNADQGMIDRVREAAVRIQQLDNSSDHK